MSLTFPRSKQTGVEKGKLNPVPKTLWHFCWASLWHKRSFVSSKSLQDVPMWLMGQIPAPGWFVLCKIIRYEVKIVSNQQMYRWMYNTLQCFLVSEHPEIDLIYKKEPQSFIYLIKNIVKIVKYFCNFKQLFSMWICVKL